MSRSAVWAGCLGRRRDAEDAQLQGQGGVVADQRRQLDQTLFAQGGDRLVVLLVVQVAGDGQSAGGRVRDARLLVGELGIVVRAQRVELRFGQPGVAADRLVRGLLVIAAGG